MKNLIKSVIKYRNNIKDKNRKDLKEISTFLIKNLLITHEINQKVTEEKIFTMLEDLKGTSHVESLKIIEGVVETIHLSGDVCEFGVAQGKTSKLISYLIMNTQKNIYLYDSFEGLPKPGVKDKLKDDIFNLGKMEAYEGRCLIVKKKFLKSCLL